MVLDSPPLEIGRSGGLIYSTTAAAKLRGFVEALTNWYIRRSRDRFWVGVNPDDPRTTEAFDTLYTVLETLTRLAAPLIPLVSERIWQGLTGERSVHLTAWPDPSAFAAKKRASGCVCRCQA